MMEAYSRKLSPKAKERLTDFIEAYIKSLKSEYVDKQAVIAKQAAIRALQTDIDILVFIDTIKILYSSLGIDAMKACLADHCLPREVAKAVVQLSEDAHNTDKRTRMADPHASRRLV